MPITITQVQERVARYFDVPVQHLKSDRRHGRLVRAAALIIAEIERMDRSTLTRPRNEPPIAENRS